MTSVATSFFAPSAATSPGVVTAAQTAEVPFGTVLSTVAANDSSTTAEPGIALADETTPATASSATSTTTPPTGIAALLAAASPTMSAPVATPTPPNTTITLVSGTLSLDGGAVVADEAKAGEAAWNSGVTIAPAPSAPVTPPIPKSPSVPTDDAVDANTTTLDRTALPETVASAAAITTSPSVITTSSISGSEDGADRPRERRSGDRSLAADATEQLLAASLPLPLAALALAAPPPTAISKPDTKTDTKADATIATSSTGVAIPEARGQMPVATDQPVAPIVEGRGEQQSGTGDNAHASPSRAALPTDKAPDPSAPREGNAAFTLPSLLGAATTSERTVPAMPSTITAQPGRMGQELGVAIAHHVARGDAAGGGDTITLRLNPADMGKIEVKLSFDDGGTLRAVVSADNATALDMLRRDSADLGRALNNAGVRADSQTLRFDTRAGTGQGGGQGNGNGNPWQHQAEQKTDPMSGSGTGATDDITTAYRPLRLRGRVDMVA